MQRQSSSVRYGKLMLVDIIDFSLQDGTTQTRLVLKFLEHLREVLRPFRESSFVLNGTGDGVLLAFVNADEDPGWMGVIDLAIKLKRRMQASERSRLRIAVHEGHFYKLDVAIKPKQQVIGTAVNECARLIGAADGEHVVVSQRFLDTWRDQERSRPIKTWPKSLGKTQPYDMTVKHGGQMFFRLWTGNDGTRRVAPRLLAEQNAAGVMLLETMTRLDREFVAALCAVDPSLTRKSIDSRVSLMVRRTDPMTGETKLHPTQFRIRFGKQVAEGNTSYSIKPAGGLPGRSFVRNRSYILPNLCKYDPKMPSAYLKEFDGLGLTLDDIKAWGRHARTLLTFPVAVASSLSPVIGVVCFDVMNPLENISVSLLEALLERFEISLYPSRIAALCRLRGLA